MVLIISPLILLVDSQIWNLIHMYEILIQNEDTTTLQYHTSNDMMLRFWYKNIIRYLS